MEPASIIDTSGDSSILSMLDPRSPEFRRAVRMTPATLAYYRTAGSWIPAKHLLHVSSVLAQELIKGDARILVMLPPRHGKSELLSYHTSIWWLELFPHTMVMLVTYGADLSTDFGRRVRDAFLNDQGVLETKLTRDVQRTELFMTSEGGGMAAVGIGGPITGRGTHLLLVDDYIKNIKEANSPTLLNYHWDWFTTTAYTRLEPGGNLVVLATRWDYDDLIGRLERGRKTLGGRWIIIRLPALAMDDDPIGRNTGDPLWPERYSKNALLERQALIGPHYFSALYQQTPIKREDAQIDTDQIRILDILPHRSHLRWVRSWDLAGSQDKGDYTVGTLMGCEGTPGSSTARTYLADQIRGRWGAAKVEEKLRTTAEADGYDIPIVLEQEPGSAGKAYAKHLSENVLKGFNVTVVPAANEGSKWAVAQPFVAAVASGRIAMIRASWNASFATELKAFPFGDNDDQVDSCAKGYNKLHGTRVLSPTWGRGGIAQPTAAQVAEVEASRHRASVTFGR